MANVDYAFGLRPITQQGGTIKLRPYHIPSTETASVFVGDPVVKTGTSNTAAAGVGGMYQIGALQQVAVVAAGDGNETTGVVCGFVPDPSTLDKTYGVGSTDRVALVCDDPTQEYVMQCDSGHVPVVADFGLNANFVAGSGDVIFGRSGFELDIDAAAATATFQVKIQRLYDTPDNTLLEHANVVVTLNNSTESNITAGV